MIKVLHDKVLVQKVEPAERTVGGIFLPCRSSDSMTATGIVMAVGPGTYSSNGAHIPVGVEVGQTVLFNKMAGVEVTHQGEDYILMEEMRIDGIVTE